MKQVCMNELRNKFVEIFGEREDVRFYSAPGRVEIGGNHTDHQKGFVLAAAIDVDMRAAAAKNTKDIIRMQSEGYPMVEIDIRDLSPKDEDKNTTAALVRGVVDGISRRGIKISGADMYIVSDVMRGSGLSSSAAFEVLCVTAFCDLFGEKLAPADVAYIGQYAERIHFGKPCGLMDQTAIAYGGIIAIDFSKNPPHTEKIDFDFKEYGYDLVIIDAGVNHADLTEEYASIPGEMRNVAGVLAKDVLSEVSEEEFYNKIAQLRQELGDRAVLRAIHYFNDTRRAREEVSSLKSGDIKRFLELIRESGDSSFKYLQNIYVAGSVKDQAMAFTLALCEKLLDGDGAVRIQGGGFGGTLEAFVPKEKTEAFRQGIEKVLGEGKCTLLSVRRYGGTRMK